MKTYRNYIIIFTSSSFIESASAGDTVDVVVVVVAVVDVLFGDLPNIKDVALSASVSTIKTIMATKRKKLNKNQ